MDVLFGILFWVGLALLFVFLRSRRKMREYQESDIPINVDGMNGHDFEAFTAKLLRSRGFSVSVTSSTGDFGADVIASKADTKYAVQCKRNAIQNKVSVRAVQEAVAAMPFYDCGKAMVIATGYFTNQAVQYAEKVGCDLVGRDTLMTWIEAFDRASRKDIDHRKREVALRNAKVHADRLNRELKEIDDTAIVPSLEQNSVLVLRELASLLGLSQGKDRKSELVKRIATRIKTQRATRKPLV